jgi:hypothetical protein
LGKGTRLCQAQKSQIADSETNISPAYYFTVGTIGNAMKCCIISAGLLLEYLQASLFIPIYQTAVGIISSLELAKEASNFQYVMGKS